MKSFFIHVCLLLVICSGAMHAQAQSKIENNAILKPVKALIPNIRANKDAQAFQHVNLDAVSRYLLQDWYAGSTETQRKEFARLFQSIFTKIAFPRVRENLKNLTSQVYDPPQVTGHEATVDSRIELFHEMKKQEIKMKYSLVKEKGAWKIVDVAVLGGSVLKEIREQNVQPKLKEGGITALLGHMQEL
jgi:phospholipid transport system substrate-binding protein